MKWEELIKGKEKYRLMRQYDLKSMFLIKQEKQLKEVVHLAYQVLWESEKQAILLNFLGQS